MTRWERLEEYLYERDLLGEEFNHAAVVQDLRIPRDEASKLIQSYLTAQNAKDANTLFVLRRVAGTRTASSMWHVGERSLDARALGEQWAADATRRVQRVIDPSIRQIAERNPRALPAAQAVAKGIEAALELMAALLLDEGR